MLQYHHRQHVRNGLNITVTYGEQESDEINLNHSWNLADAEIRLIN